MKYKLIPILIFSFLLISVIPLINIVKASDTTVLDNFDSYNLGDTSGVNGDFYWYRTSGSDFEIAGSGTPGGDKYITNQYHDSSGYFNNTYNSYTGYYVSVLFNGASHNYFTWYNTTGAILVEMDVYVGSTTYIKYKDYNDVWQVIYSKDYAYYSGDISWGYLTENVIRYSASGTYVNGTGSISGDEYTGSSQFYSKSCFLNFGSGSDQVYIYEYGTNLESYNPPNPSGCVDFSGYSNIAHVGTALTVVSTPSEYIEFVGGSSISAKLTGFILIVEEAYQDLTDLSRYGLYMNNIYVGSPICYYYAPGGAGNIFLEWDFTAFNIQLQNETPMFELYHDNSGSSINAWFLGVGDYVGTNPVATNTLKISDISHINGIYDGEQYYEYSPNWILYYTDYFSDEDNPGYSVNDIGFLSDINTQSPIHPVYDIPFTSQYKTIYFDVYVIAQSIYNINVFFNGNPVGYTQYFPKEVIGYHDIIGFIPYDVGNYTVSLYDGDGYYLNKTFYSYPFISMFSIWSFPNPSTDEGIINIGVFASNPTKYQEYLIGGFLSLSDVNNIDNADIKQYISDWNSGYYYFSTMLASGITRVHFRLFATNNSIYIPISSIHTHYIRSFITNTYLATDLINNVGYTGIPFNIYGSYGSTVSSATIFLDNLAIKTSVQGDFSFSYTINSPGTYRLNLKEANADYSFFTLREITISIVENPIINIDKDIFTEFLATLSLPLKIGIGLLLTLIITLLPLIIGIFLSKHSMIMPDMVYVGFFFLGLGVSSGIGFLPWALFFVILFGLIIYFVIQRESNKQ